MPTGKSNKIIAFHKSVIGSSHLKKGTVCQDYSFSEVVKYRPLKEYQYAVAMVADGHGSADYFRSDRGSRFACEAARKAINLFLSKKQDVGINHKAGINSFLLNPDTFLEKLKSSIITLWHDAITEDLKNDPFTQEELAQLSEKRKSELQGDGEENIAKAYGTTLIVIAKHSQFWFGLHIGDGKCAACLPDATINQPIPWDDKCFLNVTTSMCDYEALLRFRHYFSTEPFPDAVYVATDGVDDSFGTDEFLHDFYKKITISFFTTTEKKTTKELFSYLPTLSEKGSGDDISISGIINLPATREMK